MHSMTKLFRPVALVVFFTLALAPTLAADVITVGTDGPCDFVDLQDAIDAAWDGAFVRVQQGWHGDDQRFAIVDKSLTITGGYERCWGEHVGRTTLYVKNDNQVLAIRSLDKRSTVRLRHLAVSGARPEDPDKRLAGGVAIYGDVDVEMEQVEVHHATRPTGAGIHLSFLQVGISERRPTLTLLESRLYDNYATSHGGGLSCRRANIAVADSTFDFNGAPAGGGASLSECRMSVDGEIGPLVLFKNWARDAGAGLTLSDSVLTTSAGKDGRASLEAVGNYSYGMGGAIHLAANSVMEANAFLFEQNVALESGGVISARKSNLFLGRDLESCWSQHGCQTFRGNIAGKSGGVLDLQESHADLQLVMARGNVAIQETGAFAAAWVDSGLELTNAVLTENRGTMLIDADHARSLRIVSSTIFENDIDAVLLWIPGVPNTLVSQSILVDETVGYLAGGEADFLCNVVHGPSPLPQGAIGSLWADPLFRAPGDFHLDFDTPAAEMCEDDGSSPHGEIDFDFEARPSRGKFEPGADELD